MMENKEVYLNALQDGYPVVQELDRYHAEYKRISKGVFTLDAGVACAIIGTGGGLVSIKQTIASIIKISEYGFGNLLSRLIQLLIYTAILVTGIWLITLKNRRLNKVRNLAKEYADANYDRIGFVTDEYWSTDAFQYLYKIVENDRVETWNEALNMADTYLHHEESIRQIKEESEEIQKTIWMNR